MKLRDILLTTDPASILHKMDKENTLVNLEPSLAALRLSIPKGYHHKDNLTHSINVLKNAVSLEKSSPDLILRTAALFHDIGKPATRVFHKNSEVTFNNHEAVGAKMVKTILVKHGYSKDEILSISKLIRLHMRSYGFSASTWTDSAVRRLIVDTGDVTALQRLIIIFYSDVTTSIPAKKIKLHSNLDALVDKVNKVAREDERKSLRPAINGNQIMERTGLTPGPQLGQIMKYLNSDEGLKLSETEAWQKVEELLTNSL